ncbi:MAG: cation:proton antiporter domain-containing protein [Gemmatirosa sp.]
MHSVDPALLTIAAAVAAGLLAQIIGHRLRVPAIVPLLVLGVALGPSGLGVVVPASLGGGLSVIVKLCVAVILFDGALNLRLADLRRAMREVRNLVTVGVLVSWIGATLAAWLIAGFSVSVAIVFGALMTVTGPTVVQPLLRRVSIPRRVRTVLEGEAILIDPVGAVLAVAVVDVVLGLAGVHPIGVLSGAWGYVGRLLVGLLAGGVGGLALSWTLRRRGLVPAELVNLVSLAFVWAAFAAAEWAQSEAGIMAAVVMGLTMQRGAVPEERRLRRFKEQLTVLGISILFVLLAAALPLGIVRAEGWRGILTVLSLIFVVRPLCVLASLRGSPLSWRERLFVMWISPRGIVAASVASLFAVVLDEAGFAEGTRILAITFMAIAITVTLQGLTAAAVARLLGLRSLAHQAVIVVGCGPLARGLAEVLQARGRAVTLVDHNAALVDEARAAGFDARLGNALDEDVLAELGAEEAATLVAVTTNSEVNALATHLAHDAFGVERTFPALGHPSRGAGPRLLERVGGRIAFGRPIDVRAWEASLEEGTANFVTYRVPPGGPTRASELPEGTVPIARVHGELAEIVNADLTWRAGDELVLLSRLPESVTATVVETAARRRGAGANDARANGTGSNGAEATPRARDTRDERGTPRE